MTPLRQAAAQALEERVKRDAEERRRRAEAEARDGLARALISPLKQWFPEVEWEWVGKLTDGSDLVRELTTEAPVLGVKPRNTDGEHRSWLIAVMESVPPVGPLAALAGPKASHWTSVRELKSAADLGAHFAETEPAP